ncbi:VOC family protein [Pseudomonas sp. Pseusp97]|uniref:VOC family protein n=1 Tax=Pseudomonas sp. Pseusp97 TaxID=3243065 RepID=UPI0039A74D8B
MTSIPASPRLATPQPARHPAPTVKAQRLAHLIFERPDLEEAARFLTDFGLTISHRDAQTLYLRAADPTPYCYRVHRGERARFLGFGLEVGSREDLERLARIPGASSIEEIPHPGGGRQVRLVDPSGFLVEAICAQSPSEPLPHRPALALNFALQQPRINGAQRPPVAPPEVLRLGHLVLEVADYQATCGWYTQHLGFIPSDVQVLEDGSPIVAFMRLDRGETPADHHTLAIAQGFVATYSHSAYELVDADAVGMGQRVLRERNWKHAWGIGRHILGSQIFDYWQDPWGDKHEHYCDGDLFTASSPTGIHYVSAEAMSQWGQRMPKSFTRPRLSVSNLRALVRNLRRSPDLTLGKLAALMRLFG